MNQKEKKLLKFSINLVKESINFLHIKKNSKYYLKKKIKREFKSKIDTELNNMIIDGLSNFKFKIFSEESRKFNIFKEKNYAWIVDPLDGTFNFVRGLNDCAVSLALIKNNVLIFGVVGTYSTKDIYYGGKKIGSYKNNKKIQLSKTKVFKNAILATGFPASSIFTKSYKQNFFNTISKFAKIRMIGSAACSLAYLSEGLIDQYYEQNIKFWDIAGGLAICEGLNAKIELKKVDNSYNYDLKVSNKYLSI